MMEDNFRYNQDFLDLFYELRIQLEDYPWYFNIPEIILTLDKLRELANDLKPTKESTGT